MPYQAMVFRVMIASPSDVEKERRLIPEVLQEWNSVNSFEKRIVLIPMRWETDPAPIMGDRPQEIINKQVLKDCDLLVGIFWTRIGTPTGESVSGTVEEIEKHIDAGKPVMLYFSSVEVPPDSIESEQYEELKAFREKCKAQGRIETCKSSDEFRKKFAHQLPLLINKLDRLPKQTSPQNKFESETKRIWAVNWGLVCKPHPYKKVRDTAIGPVIERSTFLKVLNALRLDGDATISKIRDELVHDVMTAPKQSEDDYSELRDHQYLDLNFEPFESKWELLRLEVKAKADALGVPTGTAN